MSLDLCAAPSIKWHCAAFWLGERSDTYWHFTCFLNLCWMTSELEQTAYDLCWSCLMFVDLGMIGIGVNWSQYLFWFVFLQVAGMREVCDSDEELIKKLCDTLDKDCDKQSKCSRFDSIKLEAIALHLLGKIRRIRIKRRVTKIIKRVNDYSYREIWVIRINYFTRKNSERIFNWNFQINGICNYGRHF